MITDIHCHIIPDIDDGPATLEESLMMAQIALNEEITTIVASPHFTQPKNIEAFVSERDAKLEKLREYLEKSGTRIEVIKGAEVYIDMELFEIENLDKLTINSTRYILIELPMTLFPIYTEEFLYRLQLLGYIPIIAHPERNESIVRKPELLYNLVDMGSLIQVNSGSITGLFGSSVQKCVRTIIKRGMVHMVATDAHSKRKRQPLMTDCIKMLNKLIGYENTKKLVFEAPAAIVRNRTIDFCD